MTVSIRELKARLSQYLAEARAGKVIRVTSHRTEIAICSASWTKRKSRKRSSRYKRKLHKMGLLPSVARSPGKSPPRFASSPDPSCAGIRRHPGSSNRNRETHRPPPRIYVPPPTPSPASGGRNIYLFSSPASGGRNIYLLSSPASGGGYQYSPPRLRGRAREGADFQRFSARKNSGCMNIGATMRWANRPLNYR